MLEVNDVTDKRGRDFATLGLGGGVGGTGWD